MHRGAACVSTHLIVSNSRVGTREDGARTELSRCSILPSAATCGFVRCGVPGTISVNAAEWKVEKGRVGGKTCLRISSVTFWIASCEDLVETASQSMHCAPALCTATSLTSQQLWHRCCPHCAGQPVEVERA